MKLLAIILLMATTAANAAYQPMLNGKVLVSPDHVVRSKNGREALRVKNVYFLDSGVVGIRVGYTLIFSNGAICDMKTRECTQNGKTCNMDTGKCTK